jgi:hypothetical protein
LPPGQWLEVDLQLKGGQQVSWTMSLTPAGAAASSNVHTHDARGNVEYLYEAVLNGSHAEVFTAPRDGLYSWMIENNRPGQGVVTATIDAQPATAPGSTSTPGLQALVAALAAVAAALASGRAGRKR